MAKTLVLQAARFGDLVQTGRLIRGLSDRGEVHLVLDRDLAELAELLYPGVVTHPLVFHGELDAASLRFNEERFAGLGREDFDQVFNCNYTSLTSAICRMFPKDAVIGYRPADAPGGGILRSAWMRLAFRASRIRSAATLNLVDLWGLMQKDPPAPAAVNPPAKPGGKGLGVVLAGREARRSLPAGALAKIIETLFRLHSGPNVRLFGTGREKPLAARLLKLLPPQIQSRTEDLSGKTSWADLMDNLAGLDLLLAPDTGTMHLAAFLGVPVMAFFLSSAWVHETGPYGAGHLVWQAADSCSPCLESAACPHGTKCGRIFAEPEFLRMLSAAVTGNEKILAQMPPGLQLWRTGFDGLGQKLELAAGSDPFAGTRKIVRSLIGASLGLAGFDAELAGLAAGETALLAGQLFPEEEWMVPAGLYH